MNNEFKPMAISFILSFEQSAKNSAVLIIGHQDKGKVSIVNAFEGQQAIDLYKLLTIPTIKAFEKK